MRERQACALAASEALIVIDIGAVLSLYLLASTNQRAEEFWIYDIHPDDVQEHW